MDGELAIGVPAVHALHPRHGLARPEGAERVEPLDSVGLESKQQQDFGGHAPDDAPRWAKLDDWRRTVYENSLLLAMGAIFVATWLGQSLNNWREFNATQREHGGAAISWGRYLLDPDWSRTLQNWQSEFLAVGIDGRLHDLSPPARLARVETRRRHARRDRLVRIGRVPGTVLRTRP